MWSGAGNDGCGIASEAGRNEVGPLREGSGSEQSEMRVIEGK